MGEGSCLRSRNRRLPLTGRQRGAFPVVAPRHTRAKCSSRSSSSQSAFAIRLGVSYPRLNEIINGRRAVTPDTALRLSRVLGMPADFWLGLQQDWDLWQAMHGPNAAEIARLKPIPNARGNGAA